MTTTAAVTRRRPQRPPKGRRAARYRWNVKPTQKTRELPRLAAMKAAR
jgi:hypothetical protein